MQLSQVPPKIVEAFAVNGNKRTVPAASQIPITPGAASFNDGFPPLNGTPVNEGGIPPSILDMNGVLNQMSGLDWWMSAGASYTYDAAFSAAVGGYPRGTRLLNGSGPGFWISLVDNNLTDPDTNGTGWYPDHANASVYASNQQSIAVGTPKVLWDTVEWDNFGLWNAGSKCFQAIWPGKYRVSGAVALPAPGGSNFAMSIWKNGTLVKNGPQYPQVSDGGMSYTFDAIVLCAVGDQLTANLFNPDTATLAGNAGSNQAFVYGQIEYVGP